MAERLLYFKIEVGDLTYGRPPATEPDSILIAGRYATNRFSLHTEYVDGEVEDAYFERRVVAMTFEKPIDYDSATYEVDHGAYGHDPVKSWSFVSVPESYSIPSEYHVPTLEEFVDVSKGIFVDHLKDYAVSKLGFAASAIKLIVQSQELDAIFREHMSSQIDLLRKSIIGDISPEELSSLSGRAAARFAEKTLQASGLPDAIKHTIAYGGVKIDYFDRAAPTFEFQFPVELKSEGLQVTWSLLDSSGMIVLGGGNDVVDWGHGNVFAGAGNDKIHGSQSKEALLDGGLGSDTFVPQYSSVFGDELDVEIDLAAGTHVVRHVTNPLDPQWRTYYFVEYEQLLNFENISGSDYDERLLGNSKRNKLDGNSGDDTLRGYSGNDTLTGGKGVDKLIGGAGSDRFNFDRLSESGSTDATRDVIAGFAHGKDRIDLSTIDAIASAAGNQPFSFIGSGSFTGEGQVRALQEGPHTTIKVNTSGPRGAEMSISLQNFDSSLLAPADFIL